MTWRVVAVAAVIITIVVYAVGSGALVSTGSTWYLALDKPAWQPASWIFGLIWPYNFVAIGVVGSVIAWNAAPARVIAVLVLLAVTVAFALTWAYLFYGPHQLTGAAIALTATAVLTLPIVAIAFAERWWLGVLLVPYQVWVAIAASLSWGYVAKAGA
jgi:tryptophan-rich sensory protein